MSSTTNIVINDCTFKWAKLSKPVDPFGEGYAWELQITTDDIETAKEWVSQNLNVKTSKDNGKTTYYVNLKRWCVKPSTGEKYTPPVVVDGEGKPIDPSTVGNGSEGRVKAYQYQWSRGGNSGTATILIAVKVTKLVEFKPSTDIDF